MLVAEYRPFTRRAGLKTQDTVNFLLTLITDFLVTQIGNELAG